MEIVSSIFQVIIVTSALGMAVSTLAKGVSEEYGEIITLFLSKG